MKAFAAEYLANLTADLMTRVLDAAGRRIRDAFLGTAREQALQRCLEAGIVALLAAASVQEPDRLDTLAGIFGAFFQDPDVGREAMAILAGGSLRVKALLRLLRRAGYDRRVLPDLDPRLCLGAFERALLSAAAAEPALQEVVEAQRLPARPGSGERTGATYRAALRGDGAIAQGPGAVAAGKGGVAVSGDVHGGIHVGDGKGGEA